MHGCNQNVLNEVLNKPIARDDLDIHFAANLVDLLIPYQKELNL